MHRAEVHFSDKPLGMLECLVAGLTNSAFYAMMPVFCTAIGLSLRQLSWIMSLTVFCGLGAQWLVFTVYPLAVARAHDIFGGQDVVAVSAGLLFAYSIGASVSPLLASAVMTLLRSPFGLFAFWTVTSGALALVTIFLRKYEKVQLVPVEEQVSFVPMESTSPVILASDPRTEIEPEDR